MRIRRSGKSTRKTKSTSLFRRVSAIVGLTSFARCGAAVWRVSSIPSALLQRGFAAAFVRDGAFHGTLEGRPEATSTWRVTDPHSPRCRSPTPRSMSGARSSAWRCSRSPRAAIRRVRSTAFTDPAIFEYWYERQEFLFVDFSLAEVEHDPSLVQRIVDKAAADHNLIPEMYVALPCELFPGKIGDPTGARPMVGYGAGTYILDVLSRQ